jgi:hypothetical protein
MAGWEESSALVWYLEDSWLCPGVSGGVKLCLRQSGVLLVKLLLLLCQNGSRGQLFRLGALRAEYGQLFSVRGSSLLQIVAPCSLTARRKSLADNKAISSFHLSHQRATLQKVFFFLELGRPVQPSKRSVVMQKSDWL